MATITVNLLDEAQLLAAAEQRARPGSSEREALRQAKRGAVMRCLNSIDHNNARPGETCHGCTALGLLRACENRGWRLARPWRRGPWC